MKQSTSIYLAAVFLFLVTATPQQYCMESVVDLPGSTYNGAYPVYESDYDNEQENQALAKISKLFLGLYRAATLPVELFHNNVAKSYLKYSFTTGYTFNFVRFGSLGRKNMFEWLAESMGVSRTYAPWVGTTVWNIPALWSTTYFIKDFEGSELTTAEKIKHRAAGFGALALGAVAGSAWRTMIHKSLSYGKQVFNQYAHLAKIIKR